MPYHEKFPLTLSYVPKTYVLETVTKSLCGYFDMEGFFVK